MLLRKYWEAIGAGGNGIHPSAIGDTWPSSTCQSPVGSQSGPVVARLTGVVLLFVWASSPLTAYPFWLVLLAFEVTHLCQLTILTLQLSESSEIEFQCSR